MQVSIQRSIVVSLGGKVEWKVKPAQLVTVDDEQFIKLPTWEPSLCKLICEGVIDGKLPKSVTLSQCQGFKLLLKLRNEQQCLELTESGGGGVNKLFGNVPKMQKKQRRSAGAIREMRDNPQVITISLPDTDGLTNSSLRMVRPVHACDDLCVPLQESCLETVVKFIRNNGIDMDAVAKKRAYRSAGTGSNGIWKNGNDYVVKLGGASGIEGPTKFRRFKTLHEAQEGQAQLFDDDDDGSENAGDGTGDEHAPGDVAEQSSAE